MTKARDLANAGTALGAVSATELAFVDGVTSAIQTQLDGKQAINANVSTTELGYLDGVTSAIQTQIDSKIGSASAINPTIVDAKGDIIAATAADTVARLAVGANGTVLTAASGQATGLEWATPSSGGMTSIATGTLSGTSVTLSSIAQTYNHLYLSILAPTESSGGKFIGFRINAVTTSTYNGVGLSGNQVTNINYANQSFLHPGIGANNLPSSASTQLYTLYIPSYTFAGYKNYLTTFASSDITYTNFMHNWVPTTAAVTSIEIRTTTGTGTLTGGTYTLYGVK